MGYTHYLTSKQERLSQGAFANIIHEVATFLGKLDTLDLDIQRFLPYDHVVAHCITCHKPEELEHYFATEGKIFITFGNAETLDIRPCYTSVQGKHWFTSCKTNRCEPEDSVVAALMMIVADASKGELQFTSDGSFEELANARKLLNTLAQKPERQEMRLEAAQCIWEEFLNLAGENPEYQEAFDRHGASVMRAMARESHLLDACLDGYDRISQEHGDSLFPCFDWDYVPVFVRTCVDPYMGLKNDWPTLLAFACSTETAAPRT